MINISLIVRTFVLYNWKQMQLHFTNTKEQAMILWW
jgi:hypothetical protein